MAWLPNPGTGEMPAETAIWATVEIDGVKQATIAGRRPCHVRLFNGVDTQRRGDPPWRADTTQWRIRQSKPHPFDIQEFEVAI